VYRFLTILALLASSFTWAASKPAPVTKTVKTYYYQQGRIFSIGPCNDVICNVTVAFPDGRLSEGVLFGKGLKGETVYKDCGVDDNGSSWCRPAWQHSLSEDSLQGGRR